MKSKSNLLPAEILWNVYDYLDDEVDAEAYFSAILVRGCDPVSVRNKWLAYENRRRWCFKEKGIDNVFVPQLPYTGEFEEKIKYFAGIVINYDNHNVDEASFSFLATYRKFRELFDDEIRSAARSAELFRDTAHKYPHIWKVEYKQRLARSATFMIAMGNLLGSVRDTELEQSLYEQEEIVDMNNFDMYKECSSLDLIDDRWWLDSDGE